jgi:SAM-dependent methyltransferase
VPLPGASADAVVAVHFVGHLPREAANRAWHEAARLLVPGGRLYVVDHAWHPRRGSGLTLRSRTSLLAGILRFSVFEKPSQTGSIAPLPPAI